MGIIEAPTIGVLPGLYFVVDLESVPKKMFEAYLGFVLGLKTSGVNDNLKINSSTAKRWNRRFMF